MDTTKRCGQLRLLQPERAFEQCGMPAIGEVELDLCTMPLCGAHARFYDNFKRWKPERTGPPTPAGVIVWDKVVGR
jgi:hypothetical protein